MKWTLLVILVLIASAAPAETTPADTTVTRIPPLTVKAPGIPWGDGPVDDAALRGRGGANLAEAIEHLPGVAAVRRAASAAEPVIRGLGWERVQTILGAVPLYGACPGRMDPPATYLTPLSVSEVSIFRSGGQSNLGHGGTGGAIHANPDYERAPDAPGGTTPYLEAGFESAREAWRAEGGLFGGDRDLDYKFGVGYREYHDYTAPDGTLVPAQLTSTTVNGALGWRPEADSRLWGAATYAKEKDVDFPSMPMDNIDTDFLVANAGWRSTWTDRTLTRFEVTAGLSAVDHFMDNRNKPNYGMMQAGTDATVRTWAARAHLDLAPGASTILKTGLDVTNLGRDATRTRHLTSSGATFEDRLWPDAVQFTAGGFASLEIPLGKTGLTLDGRLDVVDSQAKAADAPGLGGLTVRDWYGRYYGPEATVTDRSETLGAAGIRLDGRFTASRTWYVMTGVNTRAAGVTERYYAFGPAPGGFLVGDPSLAAEKKWNTEAGFGLSGDHGSMALSVFYAPVGDYILPTVIDVQDVNGDGNEDLIKGFENIDAELYGGELGLEYRPSSAFHLPATLSYVRGRNTTNGADLPQIPPLSGVAEIRWAAHPGTDTWLRFGAFFASDQEKIDPAFPETRTGGYAVWRVGVESRPAAGLKVRIWVDNLFDRLYHDHLTYPALMPTGGLAAGQEIPAPGRSLDVTVRYEF